MQAVDHKEVTMPSVIFETKGQKFSVATTNVHSIIKLPKVTFMPNMPEHVKGIIKHRDELYKIVDFRKILSFKSIDEEMAEFRNMIDQRERDHINWLLGLEKSVDENRKFKLTTDPHKCAFGLWYDKYETDNYLISEILKKFDLPHKKIHSIAVQIEDFKRAKMFDEAKKMIEQTRDNELSLMKNLFSKLKERVESNTQELAILFQNSSTKSGIAVDKIISVQYISDVTKKNLDSSVFEFCEKEFLEGIAENHDHELIIVLTEEKIC